MNKIKIFETEINYIKNERYKKSTEVLVEMLPDYFFEVPASSTGKYHPESSLGEGGLIRHTKLVAKIAYELLYKNNTIGSDFTDDQKDMMIMSIIMHDGLKHGIVKSDYVVFEHPLLVSKYIKNSKEKLNLTEEEINYICLNIETHMGEWVTDYKGKKKLNTPKNRSQKFVHMCDYLASRKFLDVKFDKNEIIG